MIYYYLSLSMLPVFLSVCLGFPSLAQAMPFLCVIPCSFSPPNQTLGDALIHLTQVSVHRSPGPWQTHCRTWK